MSSLDHLKELKVLVGVPSNGLWKDKFGMCLVSMMTFSMGNKIGNFKRQSVALASIAGSILPNQRLEAVRQAIQMKCSHVLWVDSDQVFPPYTLAKLVLHDKEIVGCNIATKRHPASPTAQLYNAATAVQGYGDPCYSNAAATGLQKVWRVGCGIMLVERKVFDRCAPDIFAMSYRDEQKKYSGEDWPMCEAFEAAGFDIWVDHDLSKEVGHIGDYIYDHNDVGEPVEAPVKLEVVR